MKGHVNLLNDNHNLHEESYTFPEGWHHIVEKLNKLAEG